MYRDNEPAPAWIWQQRKSLEKHLHVINTKISARDFWRFVAISGERHLFFLKKTLELSYWREKISFQTAPPIDEDLLFTFSSNTFEEVFSSI